MLPTTELVSLVVDVVYLRQAGIPNATVEYVLVEERGFARPSARRLIGQVERELRAVRRRLSLPLALSAEALKEACVEIAVAEPARN